MRGSEVVRQSQNLNSMFSSLGYYLFLRKVWRKCSMFYLLLYFFKSRFPDHVRLMRAHQSEDTKLGWFLSSSVVCFHNSIWLYNRMCEWRRDLEVHYHAILGLDSWPLQI